MLLDDVVIFSFFFLSSFFPSGVYLVQVDFGGRKPLADEHDYRATLPIHAALVETTDARHLGQVLGLRSSEQSLVPAKNK